MNAHPNTPRLSVIDSRALAIREVGYCRHPDESDIESRITRQVFDVAGRLVASSDPRLWASASRPNLATIYGLSGQSLLTDSVDAGWQLSLLNQAGSLFSFWDARGSQRRIDYDDQQRPITVTEQADDALPRVVERLTYGGSAPAFAVHNQCAKLIRHDNPASTRFVTDYGLAGAELSESQCFLIDLETPDWPSEFKARDALLEDESFVTRHVFFPTGEIERQTDAMGNVRTFAYDVAGKLSETWLLLAGEGKQPQCLVSDLRYNAHEQIESEIAGNGVKTQAEYGADDGWLIRLVAVVGNQPPLQDLNYTYDPVGNIIKLEDKAQAVTWFNNQRIEPISRYRYDSLYQLVEASGWEVANPSHGPALPDLLPTPLDPNQRRNYTQRFEYDAAGNLITRHHSDAPGFSMFTSARSNRSLAQRDDGSLPGEPEIASGFDACGNQLELQRGQAMTWDIRNQLRRVTLVKRVNELDDCECYAYDRPGHRLRKMHVSQTSGRTVHAEVRYLPNLEIHGEADCEVHHVINAEAGRCSVRALHWPEGAYTDQLRYSLCDHLGSSTLELDGAAGVLTQEHYFPFGGTACWAGKNALVAKYKTIRYSGKERDATGLYYYGYRYYASWLQRWLNADPLGIVDGLNVYRSFKNNPINFIDFEGAVVLHFAQETRSRNVILQSNVVVNYEVPKMRPGADIAFYLEQSQPGNSFTGIVSVIPAAIDDELSGIVDIYPLGEGSRLRSAEEWQSPYEGRLHDEGTPIVHKSARSGFKVSHLQAVNIFSRQESFTIGFTFNDVRGLPPLSAEGYRRVPAIVGTSRSLNLEKTYRVPDGFASVGGNIDDYNEAASMFASNSYGVESFAELSIEVKRDLLNMFSEVSDALGSNSPSFRQLFDAELQRPELQVRRKASLAA